MCVCVQSVCSLTLANTCAPTCSGEKKAMSVSRRCVLGTEEEFLYGLFLGMRRFRFLSEAPWKIVIFVFISFVSCLLYFLMLLFVFCFFLIQSSQAYILQECKHELQRTVSRIWTRVAVSISYGSNHYSTSASWLNSTSRTGHNTRSIFMQSLTGWNSKISFSTGCHTKVKEHCLPYYLPITGERIIGFIAFPKLLALCEMQGASSRIWTQVAVFISYDCNHYTLTSYLCTKN